MPNEIDAREAMQLFTIGPVRPNPGGTPQVLGGKTVDTDDTANVTGLAKVFIGWSWYAGSNPGDRTAARACGRNPNPDRDWQPMPAYLRFRSISEKRVLGIPIPAQGTPAAVASLTVALDTLFNHRTVGPLFRTPADSTTGGEHPESSLRRSGGGRR